jgi:hypothetical protein
MARDLGVVLRIAQQLTGCAILKIGEKYSTPSSSHPADRGAIVLGVARKTFHRSTASTVTIRTILSM